MFLFDNYLSKCGEIIYEHPSTPHTPLEPCTLVERAWSNTVGKREPAEPPLLLVLAAPARGRHCRPEQRGRMAEDNHARFPRAGRDRFKREASGVRLPRLVSTVISLDQEGNGEVIELHPPYYKLLPCMYARAGRLARLTHTSGTVSMMLTCCSVSLIDTGTLFATPCTACACVLSGEVIVPVSPNQLTVRTNKCLLRCVLRSVLGYSYVSTLLFWCSCSLVSYHTV